MSLTRPRNNFLATLLLASLGLPLISGRAQDKAPVQRSPRGWLDPNVREEYKKWLREDVVYVITDQERADFKKLMTDQQRDEFVIAFWARRNPDPGRARKQFKARTLPSPGIRQPAFCRWRIRLENGSRADIHHVRTAGLA